MPLSPGAILTSSRAAIALVGFLGLAMLRCDATATCDDCNEPSLGGLTVLAPDVIPTASCVPVQIVHFDGDRPVRVTRATRVGLSGATEWYADAGCTVSAVKSTQLPGSRGAVAYIRKATAARFNARAQSDEGAGEAILEAREVSGRATQLRLGGVRYADVGSCVPVWVAANDSAGAPATLTSPVTVTLTGSGTLFYTGDNCSTQTTTATLTPGQESAIVFAQFGLPGQVAMSVSAAGLGAANASFDVEGDPRYSLALAPTAEPVAVQAGECKAISVSIVDPTGAPLATNALEVAVSASNASVFADSACVNVATSVTVRGASPAIVYVQATRAGGASFTATLNGVQSRTLALSVSAGSVMTLQLLGGTRLSQGGCYRFAVQRTDAFQNPVSGVALVTGVASTLGLFSDAACSDAAATVSIPAGQASGAFYVKGASLAADVTVTATSAGLTSGVAVVDVVAPATTLRLQLPTSGIAGECVQATLIAVDSTGANNDVLLSESIAITTGDTDLVTYGDAACTQVRSTVAIPALAKKATSWVRSTVAESYTVNVTGDHLASPASTSFAVVAGAPAAISVTGPTRVDLGSCVALQTALRDQFGNAATAPGQFTLQVESPSLGETYSEGACAASSSQFTIASGSGGVSVFYRGRQFGAETLGIGATGVEIARVGINVVFFMSDVVASIASAPIVYSVIVDHVESEVMWLQTFDGMVHRSNDSGTSWRTMCRTPAPDPQYGVGLFASPGVDGTAYTNTGNVNSVYRVDDLAGGACPSITTGLRTVYAYYATVGITVDSTGQLFAWHGCCGDTDLATSRDFGTTWTSLYDDLQSTAYMGFMANHPTNPLIKVVDRAFAGTNNGLYRSLDGGVSWSFATATGFNDTSRDIKFDPGHPGYVYKYGRTSSDNGLTWAANSGYNSLSYSWALDAGGAVYRFDTSTLASTVVQRAPDARTPVWAALTSSIPVAFEDLRTRLSVFGDGQVIAVRAGGAAYRSDDAGTVFARLDSPGALSDYSLTIAAASDVDGYAIGNAPWLALATHDGGETWGLGGVGGGSRRPVIHVNPSFPESVYVRAEEYGGTYDTHVIASQDGLATIRANDSGSDYSWATVGAVSLVDPLVFMTLGGSCKRTIDGGVTYQSRTCAGAPFVWYPSPNGYISPLDRETMWYAGYDFSAGQGLWQVSWTDGVIVNITSRTGIAPAGLEMYEQGGGYVVRVVSNNGALVSSANLTGSFGAATTASAEATCNNRYLTSLTGQPGVVAHACINGNTVAVSRDAGSSWTSLPVAGCGVRQLALFENVVVVSCANQRAQTKLY